MLTRLMFYCPFSDADLSVLTTSRARLNVQGEQLFSVAGMDVPDEEMLKEAIKKGFSILAQCYVDKDAETALRIVLDPTEPSRVRLKAAEMIGDIGELDAIDPLRNLKVGNRLIEEQLEKSIHKIHERYYTRECPFCAEIIKKKAKICKHCGKEIAGL